MKKGFTLIELLVVVAIIGVLASVVLASLNSAREKGKIAAVKSNLKNMIPEAELAYSNAGNYSTTCAALAKMLTAITNAGATAACYTHDNTRWGASARLNSDSTKNYSTGSDGVVTWGTADTASALNLSSAISACATAGGRVPSIEQLKALYNAYGATPPGYVGWYWSTTDYPTDSTIAYLLNMDTGVVGSNYKTAASYKARCIN